jgi:hypothetical protein
MLSLFCLIYLLLIFFYIIKLTRVIKSNKINELTFKLIL